MLRKNKDVIFKILCNLMPSLKGERDYIILFLELFVFLIFFTSFFLIWWAINLDELTQMYITLHCYLLDFAWNVGVYSLISFSLYFANYADMIYNYFQCYRDLTITSQSGNKQAFAEFTWKCETLYQVIESSKELS